ncbi:hypothetical protein F0562_009337 [Nyssa sinensis]|uniref:Uncharacterized protein n=1 Tax=Nyssa sinensis TaxID=561372 RepID=A0A5J4ZYD0_9ASTE|nr:hypothetical protein F0562_009337 [Nyssa sinensis]
MDGIEIEHTQERFDYESQDVLPRSPLLPNPAGGETQPESDVDGHNSLREKPLPDKWWSIFKVPAHVREIDERAYTPRIVSIGPFHYKQPGLEAMEAQKQRFLRRMLERISHQNKTQRNLEDVMEELEVRTRACYSEESEDIRSDDFVRMMVVDGCFIVELLRLSDMYYENVLADDPIFATRAMPISLGRDLLLLENQLPLFVLQKLFQLTSSGGEATPLATKKELNMLALKFFEPLRLGKDVIQIENFDLESEYSHLFALFQSSFAPANPHPSSHTQKEKSTKYRTIAGEGWVRGAKSLRIAGVWFKTKSGNVLDIQLKNRILEIPTVFIDEGTGPVRILVVYEQYNRCAPSYFSSFAVLLNNIVNKPDDVAILKQSGIIWVQWDTDEELMNFIKSLTKELMLIDMVDFQFGKLIRGLRKHCQSYPAKLRLLLVAMLPYQNRQRLEVFCAILEGLESELLDLLGILKFLDSSYFVGSVFVPWAWVEELQSYTMGTKLANHGL